MPSFPEDDADLQLANRETVRLPVQRRPQPAAKPARRAPLALAATVTTVWAALVSLAPVLVVVALVSALDGSGASTGVVARLGLAAWLLAHGVPIEVGIGPVALAPLALTVLAAWRVYRAGVHTARAVGARRGRAKLPPFVPVSPSASSTGCSGCSVRPSPRIGACIFPWYERR